MLRKSVFVNVSNCVLAFMAVVLTRRAAEKQAEQTEADTTTTTEDATAVKGLSRGQRKRMKKTLRGEMKQKFVTEMTSGGGKT